MKRNNVRISQTTKLRFRKVRSWAKSEWSKKSNPESPHPVNVTGTVKLVAFIEKDSRRFPGVNG